MNKTELIQQAAVKLGLPLQEVRYSLDAFLGVIGAELKKGGEVNIIDFGSVSKVF